MHISQIELYYCLYALNEINRRKYATCFKSIMCIPGITTLIPSIVVGHTARYKEEIQMSVKPQVHGP